jgi:dipeptidyl aminopeptidase/acylaminoacyl peptidase
LQGAEDKIVPPSQSEAIAEALRRSGRPVAYLLFAGEGHGFRSQEVLKQAVEAQLSFVGETLGFAPADAVPKLKIDNWPRGQ